jgi:hypothetical protein
MTDTWEFINLVNQCRISEFEMASKEFDPNLPDSYAELNIYFLSVQAAIIHTYQLAAYSAVRQEQPMQASELWKYVCDLCKSALDVVTKLEGVCPRREVLAIYNLALSYMLESQKRYDQNLKDAEYFKELSQAIQTEGALKAPPML